MSGDQLHSEQITSMYPPLSKSMKERLVAETVHAVAAIGGHDNPPARHIVGSEGVTTVKEKLKTVSEELEEFVDTSASADMFPRQIGSGGRGANMADSDARDGDADAF